MKIFFSLPQAVTSQFSFTVSKTERKRSGKTETKNRMKMLPRLSVSNRSCLPYFGISKIKDPIVQWPIVLFKFLVESNKFSSRYSSNCENRRQRQEFSESSIIQNLQRPQLIFVH